MLLNWFIFDWKHKFVISIVAINTTFKRLLLYLSFFFCFFSFNSPIHHSRCCRTQKSSTPKFKSCWPHPQGLPLTPTKLPSRATTSSWTGANICALLGREQRPCPKGGTMRMMLVVMMMMLTWTWWWHISSRSTPSTSRCAGVVTGVGSFIRLVIDQFIHPIDSVNFSVSMYVHARGTCCLLEILLFIADELIYYFSSISLLLLQIDLGDHRWYFI